MDKTKQFEIASADEFGSSEVVQLPSQEGTTKAVRLQKPDLIQLFTDDDAPDLLGSVAMQQLGTGNSNAGVSITKENIPDLLMTLNLVCKAAFLEPKIGEGEGELPLHHIEFADKMFVMTWALGTEYAPARNFPDKSGAHVADVPAGNGVSDKAE